MNRCCPESSLSITTLAASADHQIVSKLFLLNSLFTSIKKEPGLFESISGSLVKSFESSEIGNNIKKKSIVNKIDGTIKLNI